MRGGNVARKSAANQPTMQLNVLGEASAAPPQQQPSPPPQQQPSEQPPSGPTGQSGSSGPSGPSQRSNRAVLAIALAVLLLAAAGGVTFAMWPAGKAAPASSPLHVVPGTVQAAVLSPDEVSKAIGTTVIAGPQTVAPPAALTADPASCAVAVGPATVSGYTSGWTVFLSTAYEDSAGTGDYTVTQTVGVYGSADQASGVFGKLGDGLKNCPSATRTDPSQGPVKWNYSIGTATADTLVWTATQDAGGGWACYRQARLKGKDVVQVAVCEAGDGGSAAAQVAEQFTARMSG
jgi:hypothetical protein